MLSINFGMQITSRFVKRLMKNTDSFNHGAVICYFKHAFNGHSNDNFKISDWNCVTDNCFFEILMSRGEMPIDLIVLRVRSIISFFFLFGDNSMSHFTQNRNENRKTPANIHQWMEWLFNIISMYEYWVSICLFLPIFFFIIMSLWAYADCDCISCISIFGCTHSIHTHMLEWTNDRSVLSCAAVLQHMHITLCVNNDS